MIPARGKNRVPTAADVILVRGTCHRPLPWPQKPETRSSPPPPVNLIGLPDQERLLGKVGLTSFRRRRGGSAADHRNDPGASPIAACPNPSWPSPTSSATPSCWTKTRPRGGRRDSRSRRTRPSLRGRTATGTRTTSSTSPFATTSPRTLGLDQRRNDGRRRRLPHRGQSRLTIPGHDIAGRFEPFRRLAPDDRISDHGRSSSGRSTGYPLHRSSHRDRGPSACGRARTELSIDASRAACLERPDYAACSIIAGTLVLRVADVAERLYWLEWQVLRGFPGGWSWRIGAISASCNGPSPVVGARLSYSLFIVLFYGFSAGPRDP